MKRPSESKETEKVAGATINVVDVSAQEAEEKKEDSGDGGGGESCFSPFPMLRLEDHIPSSYSCFTYGRGARTPFIDLTRHSNSAFERIVTTRRHASS